MEVEKVSFKEYIKKFSTIQQDDFSYLDTPVQIYHLKDIASHLKTPTPLLKANFNFIVHLTSGTYSQQIGIERRKITAHSVLLVGYGSITSLIDMSDNINGYFILFENITLNQLLAKQDLLKLFSVNPVIDLSKQNSKWIEKLNKLLYQELIGANPNKEVYTSLFQAELYKILEASKPRYFLLRRDEIAFKFQELAYRFYATQKNISFYAQALHVSENYMTRCVKQALGKAPKYILTEITILQSQLLLQDFTKEIAEIAYQLNYEDPSYFGRLFKKITGVTPTGYRDALMHDLSG